MKNKKIYIFFSIIINILYVVSIGAIGVYMGTQYIELEFAEVFIRVLVLMLMIYAINFVSVIWHEIGHLLFGIKAKFEFASFSILNIIIKKEKNKVKIKMNPTIPGVAGYCNLIVNEKKEYSNINIICYFLGGIIFNVIIVVLALLILMFNINTYVNIIMASFIATNLYMAINNSIPFTLKSGIDTDMCKIINCIKDPEYFKVLCAYCKIQKELDDGIKLKDVDEKLFYIPNDFSNPNKVMMAQMYIDYIAEKKQYKEAKELDKKILENAKNVLAKPVINLVTVNLIYYSFKDNCDIKTISEYWNNDINQYLNLMKKIQPQFIGINYMYFSLIAKDEQRAQKYLREFEKNNKKYLNPKDVEETKQIILSVNEILNKK